MQDTNSLIELLKKWLRSKAGGREPDLKHTDYQRWRQTEEEYQTEQAAWLAQVRKRKREKNED